MQSFRRYWMALLAALTLSVTVASEGPRILVVGDSIAAGYGLEPEQSFPALLQEKIRREGWNWIVQNAGVSGDTSAGGVRRMNWLLKQQIDVLILELGGNDGLRGVPPEATRTNLQAIISKTKSSYPDAAIVLAGMQMPANMGAEYTKNFSEIFPELAATNKAALVPFLLEGVGGVAHLNQEDRIHPTAEGQEIVADNIWKVLRPLLERRAGARAKAGPSAAAQP